jgi:hypothetical protein
MSSRTAVFQGVLVALVVFLMATVALDWLSGRVPGVRSGDLLDRPPDVARVFTADLPDDGQLVLKPFYDFGEGDAQNDRALAHRLGVPPDSASFLVLLAVDFAEERPLELRLPAGAVRLRLRDGRTISHRNLSEIGGAGSSADGALWGSAFGIPGDGVRVPPRSLRKLVIAFPGKLDFSTVESASYAPPEPSSGEIAFRRLDVPKADLDSFLESPRVRLGETLARAKGAR